MEQLKITLRTIILTSIMIPILNCNTHTVLTSFILTFYLESKSLVPKSEGIDFRRGIDENKRDNRWT
jgi:hypothetical protein